MPSLRLGNQETSYVVQIYNDPEWNETVKELFSNIYQYHDTKPNPINIDWLLGLTPTKGYFSPPCGTQTSYFYFVCFFNDYKS